MFAAHDHKFKEAKVMMLKTLAGLAFAAGCLTAAVAIVPAQAQMQPADQLVTNGPQASGGDTGGWSARRNVIESQHYDRLVETSPGFRHARMRKECGPITDPQLHASCLASFSQDEPMVGSSTPPHRYRYNSNAGR
ncbi:MAG TPA: hypothetical protein VFQ82_15980 [Stellaceae bacterium]|nr:hypothetical protein [Stellaceae bacterium]